MPAPLPAPAAAAAAVAALPDLTPPPSVTWSTAAAAPAAPMPPRPILPGCAIFSRAWCRIFNSGVDPDEFSEIDARIRAGIANLNTLESLEALRVDRLRSDAQEEKPYVIYPVPARDDVSFEQLIETATQYRDYFFTIFISDEISATHYKRLVRCS